MPVLIHQGTTFCENVSLELANPVLLQPLALQFPRLRMVIAHLGHPWIAETLVLIRKHRHLYSDISALYYRPWQFYNALSWRWSTACSIGCCSAPTTRSRRRLDD